MEKEQKQMLNADDLMDEKQYGFPRVRTYQILNDKTLPVIRLGRRLYVRRDDFEKWLDTKQVRACE